MAANLTSNSLIESVKRRASLPSNSSTFQNADYLAFANEEMMIGLIPSILSFHEDYLLYTENVTLVDNQSNYSIPYRAIGNKLRELSYVDTNSNVFELSRITVEDLPYYQGFNNLNSLKYYYVYNNEIILVPSMSTSNGGSLNFSYYLRPNELVEEDRIATVQNINLSTGEIFIDAVPENFTSSILYDFIQQKSPHKTLSFDIPIVSINSVTNVLTFDVDNIPSGLAVGDQISQAGETKIPQVPTDLHSVLAQRVAARCLESIGDTQGLANANTKLQEMEQKTGMLIDNRVEGSPQKIVNRNGPLNRSRRGTWIKY